MYFFNLSLLILVALNSSVLCNEVEFNSKVEELLSRNDNISLLQYLSNTEERLGRVTPRIESIRVHTYMSIGDWTNARIALTRYLQLAGNSASSTAHAELVALGPEIDRNLAELDARWQRELESGVDAELTEIIERDIRQKSEAKEALIRANEPLARLMASGRSTPDEPEFNYSIPLLSPTEITDVQVADLVSNLQELSDWLDYAGEEREVLLPRIQSALSRRPYGGHAVRGKGEIILNYTQGSESITSTVFPLESITKFADRSQAHDLRYSGRLWTLSPLNWANGLGAEIHHVIRDNFPAKEISLNHAQGYLCIGLVTDGHIWCATFLTAPVRITRQSPYESSSSNSPERFATTLVRLPEFQSHAVTSLLNSGTIMDIEWNGKEWIVVLLPNEQADEPPFLQLVRKRNPGAVDILVDKDFKGLVKQLGYNQTNFPKRKILQLRRGLNEWIALIGDTNNRDGTTISKSDFIVLDDLNDPFFQLLTSAGRNPRYILSPHDDSQ